MRQPPTITVKAPFSAPACPPEIGASKKLNPLSFAFLFNSLDTSADTVELSIKMGVPPRAEIQSADEMKQYLDWGVRHFSLGTDVVIL